MKPNKEFNKELFFAALADKTRLRLINLIGEDEVCVCFFVEVIGPNQPTISRHLAYLRRAGLVAVRRDGKWAHYKLTAPDNPQAALIFQNLREWLRLEPEMRIDRDKLIKICFSPQTPINIQGAPKPQSIGNL